MSSKHRNARREGTVLAGVMKFNGHWPADRKLTPALRRHINQARRLDTLRAKAYLGLNWRGIQKANSRLKLPEILTYAGEPAEAQQDEQAVHTSNMICTDQNCSLPHGHDSLFLAVQDAPAASATVAEARGAAEKILIGAAEGLDIREDLEQAIWRDFDASYIRTEPMPKDVR